MVKTTDSANARIAEFYDHLAPDYDQMTNFDARFVRERPFFRILLDHHRISSAIDAGCGTGFHSILLAELGVKVTAVDLSDEMLKRAKEHAAAKKLELSVLNSRLQDLGAHIKKPVDAIFCMGNTLSHLLEKEDVQETFRNFHAVTKTGGILFLQLLNYDRILKRRDRVQSVREAGGNTYVRFYDFHEKRIGFNLLRIEHRNGSLVHNLHTVPLRPWQSDQLVKMLREAGFSSIQLFGGVSMEEFVPASSADVVILAGKE